jgi:hypothetical protein
MQFVNVRARGEILFICTVYIILRHVNALLGNVRNTHTANNTVSVFSLCPCSTRRCNDVTPRVGSCHVTCVSSVAWPCCVYISEQNSEAGELSNKRQKQAKQLAGGVQKSTRSQPGKIYMRFEDFVCAVVQ